MSLISNTTQVDFVQLPTQTGGNLGSAATTVDICSNIRINQTTGTLVAPITIGLLAPTDTSTTQYLTLSNVGTGFFAIAGVTVPPGTFINLIYTTTWNLNPATGNTDFFRSGIGNSLPDGTTDTTENVSRIGRIGFGVVDATTLGATVDNFGTLTNRSNTISNAVATLTITAAQVDANSTLKVIQTVVDTIVTIASPATSIAAGRFFRLHNDNTSTANLIYNGIFIIPGTFADLQWNGNVWARESKDLSGSIIAKTPYNAAPESVVAFDGMEIKWHNSSATSYDGIALRVTSGSRSLRYTAVEHYLGNAAADGGKSVYGSNNAWNNIPNTGASATIINTVYPYAQTVTTSFLGMGNPALPNADFRQYILYDDTNKIEYRITVDKQASTGEVLAPQTGTCAIIVEKMGVNPNQIITAGTGIAINNGSISTTAGTTTRAIVKANTMTAIASGGTGTVITFGNEELDTTNSFNPATGTFVAPRTGRYAISAQFFVGTSTSSIGNRFGVILSTNGSSFGVGNPIITYFTASLNPASCGFGGSYVKTLNAGDTLTFRAFLDGATAMSLSGNSNFDYITIEEINPLF